MRGRNRARGSGTGDFGPGKSELRTVAGCVFAGARPDASESPGSGLLYAVPHGAFLSFTGTGGACQKVAGGAGSKRQVQAAHRDGDRACKHVLSRRRVSPEISAEARRSLLPLLNNDRWLNAGKAGRSAIFI